MSTPTSLSNEALHNLINFYIWIEMVQGYFYDVFIISWHDWDYLQCYHFLLEEIKHHEASWNICIFLYIFQLMLSQHSIQPKYDQHQTTDRILFFCFFECLNLIRFILYTKQHSKTIFELPEMSALNLKSKSFFSFPQTFIREKHSLKLVTSPGLGKSAFCRLDHDRHSPSPLR